MNGALQNPLQLPAIRYRLGTFTTFRNAMLARVADPDLLASAVTNLATDLNGGDTSIQVVSAVNFPMGEPFRIKIGQEYLTVVSGAGTLVWKVQRDAGVFHSQGDSVILNPPNPFVRWQEGIDSDYHTALIELWAYLADILTFYQECLANEAYLGAATQRDSMLRLASLIGYRPSPGSAALGLAAITVGKGHRLEIPEGFRMNGRPSPGAPPVTFETASALAADASLNLLQAAVKAPHIAFEPGTVVVQGTGLALKENDYLLAVHQEGTSAEAAHLLQVDRIVPDRTAEYTTIFWHDLGGQLRRVAKNISLYSFRANAAPLGHIAPRWEFLSPVLNNLNRQHNFALFKDAAWDLHVLEIEGVFRPNPWFYLPTPSSSPDDGPNRVFLDGVHQRPGPTDQNPSWAVLVTDGGTFFVFHLIDVKTVGKSAYGITANSTRLTFNEFIPTFTFPFRSTRVLTDAAALPVETRLLLPEALEGQTILVEGAQNALEPGRLVVVQGEILKDGQQPVRGAEQATVATVDVQEQLTSITLKSPLRNVYRRSTVTILANLVTVTQGETIADEVLGSSDVRPFLSFPLNRPSLTYLPSTNPDGLAAVSSSLTVTVNGQAWMEKRTLAESGPDAQEYVTSEDEAGNTTVSFGDGINGARPPRGVGNVHARYRFGRGIAGNLRAGLLQKQDSLPNLQRVTNPLPFSGGADPENIDQIRVNAPASLRTFGRAVSAADYAALALSYPGIAKASAARIAIDPLTGQPSAHPYIQLTVASADRSLLVGSLLASKLRRYLDDRRDPNVPLRIQDFDPVYLAVDVTVTIDGRFPREATLANVRTALKDQFFLFERMQFGQTIFLSALYAAIQATPGVLDSTVNVLRRLGPLFADDPGAPHDIVTGPTQIAVIDPAASAGSTLTVTGSGGFADA